MNSDKYKKQLLKLKLKNEVGMAVLKSKQTRVVYRDNQHIRIVYPYTCFLSSYNLSCIGEEVVIAYSCHTI